MTHILFQGSWSARVRIWSGLVLFVYALLHFLNLGLGLLSPVWMDAFQDVRQAIVRSPLGSVIVYAALISHGGLALWSLAKRRSLRLSPVTALQTGLGLLIPLQLIGHIVFTRYAHELHGVNDEYGYLLLLIWGSPSVWWQSALLLVVWIHGCIGLHFWLRLTRWWRRLVPWLIGGAVFVPLFALAGLLVEGRRLQDLAYEDGFAPEMRADFNWPDGATFRALLDVYETTNLIYYLLLAMTAGAYLLRKLLRHRQSVKISYLDGPVVTAEKGMTLLEMSQAHGVPHTALCGGKGRCTTCRVVLEHGGEHLTAPSPAEARSLLAVRAASNVRLACQIRPEKPLTAHRVFRPEGGRSRAHASQGEERQLAVLFLDMRGFTKRTAGLLPYDVVFLLNRFFDAIVPEITRQGGHIDKYMGDGLLALFETKDAASSARAALRAVQNIGLALERFNANLEREGETAVKIGMGLHLGHVVLGEIGSTAKAPRTIIGDTVNIASRLEAKTKDLGVELLISKAMFDAAGLTVQSTLLRSYELRGVAEQIPAAPFERAALMERFT